MPNEPRPQSIGPFALPGNWYRGALHVHTSASDGLDSPPDVIARYRSLGYDFVALTDHNLVTRCPVPPGMLLIPGVEQHLGESATGKQWHFVGLGFESEPRSDWKSPDDIVAFLRRRSALLVAAHPYWSGLSGGDLLRFPQCDALEVFNSLAQCDRRRGHSEQHWDFLLSTGARINCLAVDDTHQRPAAADFGRAWVMVKAPELTQTAILNSLKLGYYYSSTGPEILDWSRLGDSFSLRSSPARSIAFVANTWFGDRLAAPEGASLSEADYILQGPEIYLRVQVTDEHCRRAWTNPMYLEPLT